MKKNLLVAPLLLVVALGVLFLVTRSSESPQTTIEESGTVILENQGGVMEGHTPRGFQGMGTGLFVGDNLNPNFPNGDGVQIFLTFDLGTVPAGSVTSAVLSSKDVHIQGTPFDDLGALRVEEVRYEKFSSALWNLEAIGEACTFATNVDGPFSCDVSEVVERSIEEGYPYVQFRLRFDLAGDGDGAQDMVMFFKSNSNTNEPGIFELEITTDAREQKDTNMGMDIPKAIHVPVVLHLVTESGSVSSNRSLVSIRELFENTQSIWDQAGIIFDITVEETRLDVSLQRAVLRGDFRELYSILPKFMDNLHIFYVRSLNGSNGIAIGSSIALVADHTTVNAFRATAHEMGHLLGLNHTGTSPTRLLYSGTNGIVLTEEEIIRARFFAQTRIGGEDQN